MSQLLSQRMAPNLDKDLHCILVVLHDQINLFLTKCKEGDLTLSELNQLCQLAEKLATLKKLAPKVEDNKYKEKINLEGIV